MLTFIVRPERGDPERDADWRERRFRPWLVLPDGDWVPTQILFPSRRQARTWCENRGLLENHAAAATILPTT